jgi:hypothetical protein
MTDTVLLQRATDATASVLTLAGVEPSACILGTRVLTEALAYFGVSARPTPVRVLATNRAGLSAMEAGLPVDQWPDEAWSVGVDDRHPDHDLAATVSRRRFPGHLVAVADGWLLDPTAEQLNRPARGLWVEGTVGAPVPEPWSDEAPMVLVDEDRGTTLVYSPSPLRPHTWQQAPDWRKGVADLVAAVIRATR